MRAARYLIAAVITSAAAWVLTGCIVIQSVTPAQLDLIGKVRLTTVLCMKHDVACPGATNDDGTTANMGQVLLAYRVPVAAGAPAGLVSDDGALAFALSGSYTTELNAKLPPGPGLKWVGYKSDVATPTVPGQSGTVVADFTLAQSDSGEPFSGPFRYRVAVGARLADPDDPTILPTRPVICDDPPTDGALPHVDGGICIVHPLAADLPTSLATPTRDLGVLRPAAPATVVPGATAAPTFTMRYAGSADPAASFALAVTTDVPGATAAPSRSTIAPTADSTTPVVANVAVPGGTPPGTYGVTLTAALASGQTRSASTEIVVSGPAPEAPAPAIEPSPVPAVDVSVDVDRSRRARLPLLGTPTTSGSTRPGKRFRVRIVVTRRTTARATLICRGRVVGRAVKRGGPGVVSLPFTAPRRTGRCTVKLRAGKLRRSLRIDVS